MYFPLEKLIDYQGNRYSLASACIEYARKVRFLSGEEYRSIERKDALVSLKHILNENIKYTIDEDDIIEDQEEDLFARPTLAEEAQKAMDNLENKSSDLNKTD